MKIHLLLAPMLALVSASPAWSAAPADYPKVEITSSLTPPGVAGVLGQSGPVGSATFILGGNNGSISSIGLGGGVGFLMSPSLELRIEPSFARLSGGGASATLIGLVAGPLLNFSENIADSAFAFLGPGLLIFTGGGSTTTSFEFTIALGKRIPLGHRFSYSPSVSYTGITNGYTSEIGINPLQFSILL